MKTIVVASQKGGAGKTTTTLHLATLAEAGGTVLLVDLDAQGSLAFWHSRRAASTPVLVPAGGDPLRMGEALDAGEAEGVGFAFVDCPPQDAAAIGAALRRADLALVPVRPSALDLHAASATLAMCERLDVPALVVLSQCPPKRGLFETTDTRDARRLLAGQGARVASTAIVARSVVSSAVIAGQAVNEAEPKGKAAREFAALWVEAEDLLS